MTLRVMRVAGRAAVRVGWWAAFAAAWLVNRALRLVGAGRRGRGTAWWWVYERYMRSASWQRTRVREIRRAGGRCSRRRCGVAGPLDVHHRTYVLIGLDPRWFVVAICRGCHEATHGRRIPRARRRGVGGG